MIEFTDFENFLFAMKVTSEKTLHRAVCDYLRYQYPDVIFSTDLSGATKLTIGQAVAILQPPAPAHRDRALVRIVAQARVSRLILFIANCDVELFGHFGLLHNFRTRSQS